LYRRLIDESIILSSDPSLVEALDIRSYGAM
jgi:hypothetical protein